MAIIDIRGKDTVMGQPQTEHQIKIFRGTIDEVLSHRDEIPNGATVELKVFDKETPTMRLMRTWLEEDATNDPVEKQAAAQELTEFKRNMNQPRKAAGARLLYPEAGLDSLS
jgi:hypothetical protein